MNTVILVSDIFGVTAALKELAKELNDAIIIDPYDSKMMNFSSETIAYEYFTQHIGLSQYTKHLSDSLQKLTELPYTSAPSTLTQKLDLYLIGFSVGASAIWLLPEEKISNLLNDLSLKGICFYGSQIRNVKEIEPVFEIELIFPDYERHFDVNELVNSLNKIENTNAIKAKYLHGFMNECSTNFHLTGYEEYIAYLKTKILQSVPKILCSNRKP